MILRCEYSGFCVVVAEDGALCSRKDGPNDVYDTYKKAREVAEAAMRDDADVPLAVAACVIVPREMWEDR